MGILSWIIVGLIAGVLAKFIMGESMGIVLTIVLGIVGGLLGGFLANVTGIGGELSGINITSVIIATIGAVIVIAIGRVLSRS